jgi:hypothetical protein
MSDGEIDMDPLVEQTEPKLRKLTLGQIRSRESFKMITPLLLARILPPSSKPCLLE